MMTILISCAFGAISFCLIVAVCIKTLQPVRSTETRQSILDFSAAPVAVPAAVLKVDGAGQFLRITPTCALKFPKVAFHRDGPASLPLGAPLRHRFRPLSAREQRSSPSVARRDEDIVCTG
jgi:hypothetical protein